MILFTVTCFLYILILLYTLKTSIQFRYKKFTIILSVVIVSILSSLCLYYFPSSYSRLITIAMEIVCFFLITKLSILNSFFITIFLELNIAVSEYISTCLYFYISNNDLLPEKNSIIYFLILFLGILIASILDVIFAKFFPILSQQKKAPFTYLIFLLPFITIYLAINISNDYSSIYSGIPLVVFIGLLLSNYFMIYLYTQSVKAIKLENDVKLLQQKRQELNERMEIINQNYQSNHRFLHDLLHDFKNLYKFKEDGLNNEIEKSIDEIGKKIVYEFNLTLTNSSALNAVLNTLRDQIKSNHIEISTCVMCDLSKINYSDQILLFQKLLNYAIEEEKSININNRIIDLKIKKLSSNIVVKMETVSGKNMEFKLPEEFSNNNKTLVKVTKNELTHTIMILIKT